MIDWFPPAPDRHRDATRTMHGLTRWRGICNLRRVARAIDAKDPATTGHSDRVAELAGRIAHEIGWVDRRVQELREAARLHDVGKICVPDSILLTPGPLSPDEYEVIKQHAAAGARIVSTVLDDHQVAWVRHHHERWDGRGYPDRLEGDEIPEGAAILSVADAWDAMTHRSWVGDALSEAAAVRECRQEAGHQFAPWAVEALEAALRDCERRPPVPLVLLSAA